MDERERRRVADHEHRVDPGHRELWKQAELESLREREGEQRPAVGPTGSGVGAEGGDCDAGVEPARDAGQEAEAEHDWVVGGPDAAEIRRDGGECGAEHEVASVLTRHDEGTQHSPERESAQVGRREGSGLCLREAQLGDPCCADDGNADENSVSGQHHEERDRHRAP